MTTKVKELKEHFVIRGKGRVLSAWMHDGEVYIRESLTIHGRKKDVQTVAVTKAELRKMLELEEEILPGAPGWKGTPGTPGAA